MMKYLLDTNVLSEAVKIIPDRSVLDMLEKNRNEIVTAAPVWHELQYGCCRLPISRKREIIESYLNELLERHLMILPYDKRAAEWHARERARLSSEGRTPPFVDGQIAAIASVNGLVLVTRNVCNFEFFSGLTIINWHER